MFFYNFSFEMSNFHFWSKTLESFKNQCLQNFHLFCQNNPNLLFFIYQKFSIFANFFMLVEKYFRIYQKFKVDKNGKC